MWQPHDINCLLYFTFTLGCLRCVCADMRRDIQEIFRATPHAKQVMMFSATLCKEIRPVCKKFMQDVIIRPPGWPRNLDGSLFSVVLVLWHPSSGFQVAGSVCILGGFWSLGLACHEMLLLITPLPSSAFLPPYFYFWLRRCVLRTGDSHDPRFCWIWFSVILSMFLCDHFRHCHQCCVCFAAGLVDVNIRVFPSCWSFFAGSSTFLTTMVINFHATASRLSAAAAFCRLSWLVVASLVIFFLCWS